MKIADILENIENWDEHPFVKITDLYRWFKITSDENIRNEIAREILEEIDPVLGEFKNSTIQITYLREIKTEMDNYLK